MGRGVEEELEGRIKVSHNIIQTYLLIGVLMVISLFFLISHTSFQLDG